MDTSKINSKKKTTKFDKNVVFRKKIRSLIKKLGLKKIYIKIKKPLIGDITYYSIIDEWKTVFFFIPKNATTSLMKAFYHNFSKEGTSEENIHGEFPRSKKNPDISSYFKFAFVRNPYDRLVSCYLNRIKHSEQKENPRDFIGGVYIGFVNRYGKGFFYPGMSFKEFVKKVSSIPDKKAEEHFKSQHCFLTDKKGNLIPDFIGRFENLEEDFKKACKKTGIKNPPELPKKNPSKRKKDYKDYYDEETKKLVQERYKKDFDLFGYSKEF